MIDLGDVGQEAVEADRRDHAAVVLSNFVHFLRYKINKPPNIRDLGCGTTAMPRNQLPCRDLDHTARCVDWPTLNGLQ